MVISWRTAACIIIEAETRKPNVPTYAKFDTSFVAPQPGETCQSKQNQNREEGSTRTKNGRVRYLPDMLALGRQNTAGAREQGSRCRGRRGPGSGPMVTL